jgi:hypothetical protein
VERAVRTCELVMRGTYLQCESVVTRADGRDRTYRFLLNRSPTMARFEMLSLWSNVPHKLAQVLTPDATRRRWHIENLAVIGDPETSAHWSDLVFESDDRIVWTGRRVSAGVDPATAPLSFVETWPAALSTHAAARGRRAGSRRHNGVCGWWWPAAPDFSAQPCGRPW